MCDIIKEIVEIAILVDGVCDERTNRWAKGFLVFALKDSQRELPCFSILLSQISVYSFSFLPLK